MISSYYQDKTLLITGTTGFLGKFTNPLRDLNF